MVSPNIPVPKTMNNMTVPYNETLIEILKSNFTNCTAYKGSILFMNHDINQRAMRFKFRDSIFAGNYGQKHAVFHIHTYNQSIEMSNLRF